MILPFFVVLPAEYINIEVLFDDVGLGSKEFRKIRQTIILSQPLKEYSLISTEMII